MQPWVVYWCHACLALAHLSPKLWNFTIPDSGDPPPFANRCLDAGYTFENRRPATTPHFDVRLELKDRTSPYTKLSKPNLVLRDIERFRGLRFQMERGADSHLSLE